MEEELQEELRICARENCGGILKPIQKKFCSRQCQSKVKHKPRGKQKPPKKYPIWKCDKCGQVIELNFDITGNGYKARKFDKFKEEHKCE